MSFIESFKKILKADYPLIWLSSEEHERALNLVAVLSRDVFDTGGLFLFDPFEGLKYGLELSHVENMDVINAIGNFLKEPLEKGRVLILLNADYLLFKDPSLEYRIKGLYSKLLGAKKLIVLIARNMHLPISLRRLVYPINLPVPDQDQLLSVLTLCAKELNGCGSKIIQLTEEELRKASIVGKGIYEYEARHVFKKGLLFASSKQEFIQLIAKEKVRLFKHSSALNYIETDLDIDEVGGLDRFKDWLTKRKTLFFDEKKNNNSLFMPRGVLLMGVAGTGKSLCAKLASSIFDLPLFRLDLSALFSGDASKPADAIFSETIQNLEVLEPCMLWIDEVEKGFVSGIEEKGSSSSRISASFLTWMQERTSRIFVVATANRIMMLPAEILRRGRFDDIFFLDLPDHKERMEVSAIYLHRFDLDEGNFDLDNLAEATKGFSGSEIEQVIKQAVIEAYFEKRGVTELDLYRSIGSFVPLSVTMFEQIKTIKKWAHDRAIPASSSVQF